MEDDDDDTETDLNTQGQDGQAQQQAQGSEGEGQQQQDNTLLNGQQQEGDQQQQSAEGQEQQQQEGDQQQQEQDAGAPEEYADFTAPEGISFDNDMMSEFKEMAKADNLPQDKAQKYIDLAVKHAGQLGAAQANAWNEQRNAWKEDLKNDSEYGGSKFQETVTRANRVLQKYGDDKLFQDLQSTGFGDNSSLVRLLTKIDRDISEGKAVYGDGAGGKSQRLVDAMYQ